MISPLIKKNTYLFRTRKEQLPELIFVQYVFTIVILAHKIQPWKIFTNSNKEREWSGEKRDVGDEVDVFFKICTMKIANHIDLLKMTEMPSRGGRVRRLMKLIWRVLIGWVKSTMKVINRDVICKLESLFNQSKKMANDNDQFCNFVLVKSPILKGYGC